jgi:hypothetical protein
MKIQLASDPGILNLYTQNTARITMGQGQNSNLQKVIQQVNATYGGRRSHDTVDLSPLALELLNADKPKKTEEAKQPEAASGHQKYDPGMFTKEGWAEQSVLAQRDGIKTVSDLIDYAKSKLEYTMSKIDELERYLDGTGTHSDPNMTKELAETYLHNYKQSIQSDYTDVIQSHINPHRLTVDEYDGLSGGQASQVTDNLLNSISAESLGLSNLSGDPQEIMKALENASKRLDSLNQSVEDAFGRLTGGKQMTEPARSTSIFDGNTSMGFFASQMERSHRLLDTTQMKLTGQTLSF